MNTGWICPVCGRGLAPWMATCQCADNPVVPSIIGSGPQDHEWVHGDVPPDSLDDFLRRYDDAQKATRRHDQHFGPRLGNDSDIQS